MTRTLPVTGSETLVERLRNPMWAHSNAQFESPQLEKEENLAAMMEAADEIDRLKSCAAQSPDTRVRENLSVSFYVENYRFEFDDGRSYTPTEQDKALLEDAIEGYVAALGTAGAVEMDKAEEEYDDADMAAVGRALMEAIDQARNSDPWMKNWSPLQCPSEIVFDLLNRDVDEAAPSPAAPTEAQKALQYHYGDPNRYVSEPSAALDSVTVEAAGPSAEQLAVLVRYLESQSDRLTKALDNPNWTPRRSHAEGDRNAFLAAANTLDQALRASNADTSTDRAIPAAWRFMNTFCPEQGWSFSEREIKEHPSLLLKVQPLYLASPQMSVSEAMVDAAIAAIDKFPFSKAPEDDRAPIRAALEAVLNPVSQTVRPDYCATADAICHFPSCVCAEVEGNIVNPSRGALQHTTGCDHG